MKKVNTPNKTIGEIVAEDYRTAQVFEKYGIDFCCGGKEDLATTSRDKNIDLSVITAELEEVQKEPRERSQDYDSWELPFLSDYIVTVHHSYLNDNIEQIGTYANKIAEVHGSSHPEVIEIASLFKKLGSDLESHLRDEEEEFFPALKRVYAQKKAGQTSAEEDTAIIRKSLENFKDEHEEVGDALHKIRHLSKDFDIPANVCNTYVLTYEKLKEFEDDIHKHVHLENNILFPKAMKLCE
ncbi:iron-sulfur cluster repair di-iron protein [Desulfopila inferna]|nr:iron-sulfur cluster repair di-iron protein [Desulfopila inferna]